MSSLYKIGQAVAWLQTQMRLPDISPIAPIIVDEAVSFIWNAFDWRNSIVELPPFYLRPREQDYGAPFTSVPSDFQQLRSAWVRDAESNIIYPMNVTARLVATDLFDIPATISYESSVGKFRVDPCPPSSITTTRFQVEGTYKKLHTKITTENLNSATLPWDDQYFHTFRKVLKWKYLDEVGNPQAGSMQRGPDGSLMLTGAAASAYAAVDAMARREGVGDPPEEITPANDVFM